MDKEFSRRRFLFIGALTVSLAACQALPFSGRSMLKQILETKQVQLDTMDVVIQSGDVEIRGFKQPRQLAGEAWYQLRDIVPQTGYWPVILGDDEDIESLTANVEAWQDRTSIEILAASNSLNIAEWRSQLLASDSTLQILPYADKWPTEPSRLERFLVTEKRSWQTSQEVLIALVPTEVSWQIPALFKFGGWNDCPAPEIQAAISRQWHERYGAELAVMTGSTLEFSVSRPPQTREAALMLAEEQYLYCPDIVDQGVSSIEALAAALLHGKIWYFWWD